MSTELQPVPVEAEAFSAEETAAAKVMANKLMATDNLVSWAAQSMLVARRAYNVSRMALLRIVKEAQGNDACIQAIIDTMGEESLKPFALDETLQQMTGTLLPLVTAELQLMLEQQKRLEKSTAELREKARKTRLISLGFSWKPGEQLLPRAEPLTLVGHPRSLAIAREKLLAAVNAAGLTTLHLSIADQTASVTNTRNKPVVTVGPAQWCRVAVNQSKLDRLVHGWLRFVRHNLFDLVVVDDLGQLCKPPFQGASTVGTLPGALSMLRKTAEGAGAGLVTMVPVDELVVTDADPHLAQTLEKLRPYSHVVPVHLLEGLGTENETHYRWAVDDEVQETIPK